MHKQQKLNLFGENRDVMTIYFSHERFDFALDVEIPISMAPDLGFSLHHHPTRQTLQILWCKNSTSVAKIRHWQTLIQHKYISSINNIQIRYYAHFHEVFTNLQCTGRNTCKFPLLCDAIDLSSLSHQGTPQIYFDQLNVIHTHLAGLYHERDNDTFVEVHPQLN